MSDNQLWCNVVRVLAIAFVCVIVSMASCSMNRQYQVRAMVEKNGVDPLDAACALPSDSTPQAMCILRASRKEAK